MALTKKCLNRVPLASPVCRKVIARSPWHSAGTGPTTCPRPSKGDSPGWWTLIAVSRIMARCHCTLSHRARGRYDTHPSRRFTDVGSVAVVCRWACWVTERRDSEGKGSLHPKRDNRLAGNEGHNVGVRMSSSLLLTDTDLLAHSLYSKKDAKIAQTAFLEKIRNAIEVWRDDLQGERFELDDL